MELALMKVDLRQAISQWKRQRRSEKLLASGGMRQLKELLIGGKLYKVKGFV
ncbi:hypothetical protein [Paenibacillus sp. YIM B09110]|uniref:hypothetical protein n=1 Tax=Paenibacillus sp. YIM B09110 TaxID=3126102 RepID=UPI00301BC595